MRIAAALWLAFATAARAGTGTWLCDITTQDGDSIVEPGETATLRLSMDLFPDSRSIDPETGFEVYGFAESTNEVLGVRNWSTGQVSWEMNPDIVFLGGDWTVKDDATQDLHDMRAGQLGRTVGGPEGDRADPIWIADVFWDPLGDYAPRHVVFRVVPRATGEVGWSDDQMGVWLMRPDGFDGLGAWTAVGGEFRFDVVPAPGALGALGTIAPVVVFRRRRA